MTIFERAATPLLLASAALVTIGLTPAATAAVANTTPNDLLNATLWMQNSVEYKANVTGMFSLATIRLDQGLHDKNWTALPKMQKSGFSALPPAIILDCDETILDNSIYEAYLIKTGKSYSSKTWSEYVQDQMATAMPGAVAFTNYAQSKGVKVFYVTNRKKANEAATYNNMKALGFPMDSKVDTLLTKDEKPDWGSDKSSRDQAVATHYRVLLMLGDNLGDFTHATGTPAQRQKTYEKNRAHWGKDWIMMPNPQYGSFESAAFGGNYSLSEQQRRALKIKALTTWQPKK